MCNVCACISVSCECVFFFFTFFFLLACWPFYEGAHLPTAAAAAAAKDEEKVKAGNHSQKLWSLTRFWACP